MQAVKIASKSIERKAPRNRILEDSSTEHN
jgi:hypothetical protein